MTTGGIMALVGVLVAGILALFKAGKVKGAKENELKHVEEDLVEAKEKADAEYTEAMDQSPADRVAAAVARAQQRRVRLARLRAKQGRGGRR